MEEISQQALLDGGVPTQCFLVQDEQEAVELHQELVQHWKHTDRQGLRGTVQQNKNSSVLERDYVSWDEE